MAVAWIALLWWAMRRRPAVDAGERCRPVSRIYVAVVDCRCGARPATGVRGTGAGRRPGGLPIIPMNSVVSRASLMRGAAMVLWAVASLRWAGSRPSVRAETGRGT